MSDTTLLPSDPTDAVEALAPASARSEPIPPDAPPGGPAAALAELDDWVRRHCRDSVISRDTETYNRISGAVSVIRLTLSSIGG